MRNREGWEVKTLGEVCRLYQPKTISQNEMKADGEYKVYGANGVIGMYDEYNHENTELLMTCRGATCGTINISEPYSWINGNAMVIRPNEDDRFISRYLYYQLLALDKTDVITGAAQPQITRQTLSGLSVLIPPLPTQHQIVAELDTLNSIIDKKKEQLNELDNLAQATFYDMFGDPVENEKGWEVKKLGDISDLKAGVFVKADDIYPIYEESLFQCYGGNGIRGYVETSTHEGEFVLIGRQGALCGNVKKAVGKFHATEHAVVCTPIIEYNIDWFYFTLFFMNLNQYATGAAQPGLSVRKLVTIDISVPSLPLQTQFAEKIKHIEQQKSLIQRSIDDVQQLFDYTMDKYFN